MKNNLLTPASVCFIGMPGTFSFAAFNVLCEHGISISQVILAGYAPGALPIKHLPVSFSIKPDQQSSSIQQLAARHDIPVTFLGHVKNRQQQWQQLCNNVTGITPPDYVFVACFPEKLPAALVNWPRDKSINLHPSLLPKYRGPDPLFWQLRHNESHTGISLHLLGDRLDAGPILYQREMTYPVGATRTELHILLATQGALGFIQLITTGEFVAMEQDVSQATYQPMPTKSDYRVEPHWSAEHAHKFLRGTK